MPVTGRPRQGGLWKRVPAGTVSVRRGKLTNYKPRRWIKVRIDGPPKERWRMLSSVIWELANGTAPEGFKVCHRDGDLMGDELANLVLLSNADAVLHFQRVNPRMKEKSRLGVQRATARRWATYRLVREASSHRNPVRLEPKPEIATSRGRANLNAFLKQLENVA